LFDQESGAGSKLKKHEAQIQGSELPIAHELILD